MDRNKYEIAWAAGFWDGEGCTVTRNNKAKTPTLSIPQAGDEAVEILGRFVAAFKVRGSLCGPYQYRNDRKPIWRLDISSHEMVQATLAMAWPFLTRTKRDQAVNALITWRQTKRDFIHYQSAKTHCAKGHEYSNENTRIYTDPKGRVRRICISCARGRKASV